MDSLLQDVRYSLRSLKSQPGFVAAAVLSLTLGVGVNTAIFSALNSLLLRPIAVRDAGRTVYVFHATPGNPDQGTSFPSWQHYRERTETFADVMAFSGARPMSLVDGDRREQVYAEIVTGSFFSMADVQIRLGRPFDRSVDRSIDPQYVAVLGDAFWRRRFASDPSIVGKTILMNGQSFTVLGVAAAGFTGLDSEVSADLWIPLTTWAHVAGESSRLTSNEHWITTVARLKDDVTIEQAQAAMAVAGRAVTQSPEQQTRVRAIRERLAAWDMDALVIGASAFGVGLLVLVLACTNVSNLLIARAAARIREMSVRMALGSGRARLIRLWLVEGLLLSISAAVLGLVLASWILDLVVAFKPPVLVGYLDAPTLPLAFHLDARVFAFTCGLAILTAMLVSLVAAMQASKPGVMRAMKSDRMTDRRFSPGLNVRSFVIAMQMALSLLLLIPCGLFVRSWMNASAMTPGFSAEGVLILPVSSDQGGVRVNKPAGFEQQLAERVAALPGVESATVMDPVPLWFTSNNTSFSADRDGAPGTRQRFGLSRIGTNYFKTLRIPLLAGRDFTRADTASAPFVAIVNQSAAKRLWPDGNAVGRELFSGREVFQVVGIAQDAKYVTLAETSRLYVYVPLAQDASNNASLSLAVRTTGDREPLRAAIEREVKALVPNWPIFQFRSLDEGLALQRLLPRFGATVLGVLGAFGLLLAAVGMYGVMAYLVRQRAHEMGIRLALGAPISSVMGLVIKQGMSVCLTGGAIGLGAALLATPFLSSLLYGISPADPPTFIVMPLILAAVALLACYVPARFITRMSVARAIRGETS